MITGSASVVRYLHDGSMKFGYRNALPSSEFASRPIHDATNASSIASSLKSRTSNDAFAPTPASKVSIDCVGPVDEVIILFVLLIKVCQS
ncbi:MAG: hypothetical protein CMJ78_13115 [Planctomycetaceae bacterium]|nr:hypothetical protein [Planctomycetaceae bacterium]